MIQDDHCQYTKIRGARKTGPGHCLPPHRGTPPPQMAPCKSGSNRAAALISFIMRNSSKCAALLGRFLHELVPRTGNRCSTRRICAWTPFCPISIHSSQATVQTECRRVYSRTVTSPAPIMRKRVCSSRIRNEAFGLARSRSSALVSLEPAPSPATR